MIFKSLLALVLPLVALATNGVDVSQRTSKSSFSCMVKNGYKFAIVRVYQSTGKCDPNGPANINDAWSAGMSHVDGYIFPCYKCGNPAKQMSDTIAYLKNHKLQLASEDENPSNPGNVTAEVGAKVGMLWIDVEGTQYWSSNHASNVNFIQAMVDEAKRQKVNIGIYTSKSQWSPITGNSSKFSKYPLWYAHYDNKPNFSDFAAFGGWSKPAIKQYAGDVSLCSAGVDKNYY